MSGPDTDIFGNSGGGVPPEHGMSSQEIRDEEEKVLKSMSECVARLTDVSHDMGGGLREHQILLTDVDDEMDSTNSALEVVQKKVQNLLEKHSSKRKSIGLVLAVIIVIELVLLYL